MKISSIFSIVTFLIGAFVFTLVVNKIGLKQISEAVSIISSKQLVFLIFINLLGIFVSIYRWKIILQALGFPLSIFKLSAIKFIGLAINYLTPGVFLGGEPFKAFYLKTEADVPLRKSAVSIIIDEALFLSISLLTIIIGLIFLFHRTVLSQKMTASILLTLLVLVLIFYLFFNRIAYKKKGEKGFFSGIIHFSGLNNFKFISKLNDKIAEIENNLSIFFIEHKKVLFISIALTFAENLLYLLTFWLTIYFLGYQTSVQTALSIISTIYINYLMPIPGALGSLELSQIYFFKIFGMEENTGLGFTLITRIVSLFSVILGLIAIAYLQTKILCQKTGQRIHLFTDQINKILKL